MRRGHPPRRRRGLAAASHSGTAAHVALVRGCWPRPASLRLGARLPAGGPVRPGRSRRSSSGAAAPRERVYMNCSGKHAAMLLAVRARNGWPLEDYLDPAHPLQQRVLDVIDASRASDRPPPGSTAAAHPCTPITLNALARGIQSRPPRVIAVRPLPRGGRAHRGGSSIRGRSTAPASPTPSPWNASACSRRSAPRASW